MFTVFYAALFMTPGSSIEISSSVCEGKAKETFAGTARTHFFVMVEQSAEEVIERERETDV